MSGAGFIVTGVLLGLTVALMLRNLRLGLRLKRLQALVARRPAHLHADSGAVGDGPDRTRLLANLSHELRTPLSGILGMADLLLDTPLGPAQATYVRAIRTSSESLLSLVEDVLDLAKIDAGSIVLKPAPVDLHALVESVVELLAPRAQAKGLDLTARVTPDVPQIVEADGQRLRQILLNLAGNALKFTDRGGVGIRVERQGADLRIAVLDTGIGMAEARLPSLFREFDRAGAGDGRDGAGLGLAITHRLAVAMGGAVDVDTAPGRGSTFTVTLPGLAGEATEPAPAQPLAGRRVLVAGPSPFEAPWLVEALADAGAKASLSPSLEDARLRIAAERPHAVLVDRAFGLRIAELVEPAAAASVVALLVMLAPAERAELPELEAAGFNGWLVKPVRPRTLLARLAGPEQAPEAPQVDRPTPAVAVAERGLNVLVAEDDEVNALLAKTLLARLGHRALRVADGDSAAAAFAAAVGKDPFDLVLLDLRMPGTDGLAAARRLRAEEHRQGLGPARILALSANAFEEDREAARAAGMDGFLAKPLTADALTAAIRAPLVARAC